MLLLLLHEGRKFGVECKRIDAPRVTPSMRTAIEDLELEKLTIIYPGEKAYQLTDKIYVMPFDALSTPLVQQIVTRV